MINKHSMPVTKVMGCGAVAEKLFRQRTLINALLAAMLAGVVIGEGLRPFAIPFFAGTAPASPVLIALALSAGHVASGGRRLIWLLAPLVPISLLRIRAPTLKATALVLITVGGQIVFRLPDILSGAMLGYDWLLLMMELSLAATGVLIFAQAGCALRQGPDGAEGLEQSLALVVTCALALTSIAAIRLGPLHLLTIAVCWLVMMAAQAGGGGAGACAGIIAGILAGYGQLHPLALVAALAMAGLLAGVFGVWGRGGTFLGFAVGIVAMLIYGGYPTLGVGIADLAGAGVLFLLTPRAVRDKARALLSGSTAEWAWEYQRRLRRAAVLKLQKLAMVFSRLSASFAQTGGVREMAGSHLQMSRMFEQLAGMVCTGCVNYKRCWERELYSTYSQLMGYLTREDGQDDFDGLLSRRCHNIEQLLGQAENLYRQFASERRWFEKMRQCRDVVSEQLRGVSEVLGQLARQIRLDVNCRQDLEEELAERLSRWGVEVHDLTVEGTERKLPEVRLRAKVPAGENPLGVIQAMVSEVMGQPLQLVENSVQGDVNRMIFALPVKFDLDMGVAQSARDEVSGDSYCRLHTAAGNYVYMLSDGMGKGEGARAESNQALLLARDMLEAGFSAETAIKALNSLLVLRGKEKFATLDMAVIDSTLGIMKVFKTGAAPSFIKTGNKIELISGAGLPIGIVPGVEPRLITRTVHPGQYLIMVSDGVIDGRGRDEGWLTQQLAKMGNVSASVMARQILNRAQRMGSPLQDDATVLVVRVRESKNEAYWTRRAV